MRNILIIFVLLSILLPILTYADDYDSYSKWVNQGSNGKLTYVPDSNGNIIPDFSNVGYMGGGVKIPDYIPVKATVWPDSDNQDDTARIQSAIDQISSLPLDSNDFRGTLLLKKGTYEVAGHLFIKASGVVLRGEGQFEDGTVIIGSAQPPDLNTYVNKYALISVKADGLETNPVGKSNGRKEISGTRTKIVDSHVPVGAKTFGVEHPENFKVGDDIIVFRPSTAEWIHDLGMDQIPMSPSNNTVQWKPGEYDMHYERVITSIQGNEITIHAPIVDAIEDKYGGGYIYKYEFPQRLSNVGIENLRLVADNPSRNHLWTAIWLNHLDNGWVRNVFAFDFIASAVVIATEGKQITVQDSAFNTTRQGPRYSFYTIGQLNLMQRCYTKRGRHDYVTYARTPGPNVFVDSLAEDAKEAVGPHQRWATGTLFDNIENRKNRIEANNAGNRGSGHGWIGAQTVFWNAHAGTVLFRNPPTGFNYCIGCKFWICFGGHSSSCPKASMDSEQEYVKPRSLYLKQLEDRLGIEAVRNIAIDGQIDGTPYGKTLYTILRLRMSGNTNHLDCSENDILCPVGQICSNNQCIDDPNPLCWDDDYDWVNHECIEGKWKKRGTKKTGVNCEGDDIKYWMTDEECLTETYFRSYGGPVCNDVSDEKCVNGGDDESDVSNCDGYDDCVYGGTCYAENTYTDLNGNGRIDGWCMTNDNYRNQWRDCDSSVDQTYGCDYDCQAHSATGGEDAPFGEYDTGTSRECCGDDMGEYFINISGRSACCDSPDDYLDQSGNCIETSADINNDGTVDILDLSLVIGIFGVGENDPEWNATMDVTPDGGIDIFDVVFVASRFS
jgi:hypothetical protein